MNLKYKINNTGLPIYRVLITSTLFSLVLLFIRIVTTDTPMYIFLIWNLFLAAVPFFTTNFMIKRPGIKKFHFLILFSIWLLFLPNAPYIITDLMHLRLQNNGSLWLDVLVVTSFAWNGLVLCFLSLLDMHKLLCTKTSEKKAYASIIIVLFLCGFGIYLGRFLRWNSWDIIQHPDLLLKDILVRIIYPIKHLKTWGMTLGFGTFLSLGFLMFKSLQDATIGK